MVKAQPGDNLGDDDILDISDDDLLEEESAPKKRRGRRPKSELLGEAESYKKKIKVVFEESDLPAGLASFAAKMKTLGIKDVNMAELVVASLDLLTKEQWAQLEEKYTPIELRIKAALSNPNTKDKLLEILSMSN